MNDITTAGCTATFFALTRVVGLAGRVRDLHVLSSQSDSVGSYRGHYVCSASAARVPKRVRFVIAGTICPELFNAISAVWRPIRPARQFGNLFSLTSFDHAATLSPRPRTHTPFPLLALPPIRLWRREAKDRGSRLFDRRYSSATHVQPSTTGHICDFAAGDRTDDLFSSQWFRSPTDDCPLDPDGSRSLLYTARGSFLLRAATDRHALRCSSRTSLSRPSLLCAINSADAVVLSSGIAGPFVHGEVMLSWEGLIPVVDRRLACSTTRRRPFILF